MFLVLCFFFLQNLNHEEGHIIKCRCISCNTMSNKLYNKVFPFNVLCHLNFSKVMLWKIFYQLYQKWVKKRFQFIFNFSSPKQWTKMFTWPWFTLNRRWFALTVNKPLVLDWRCLSNLVFLRCLINENQPEMQNAEE